MCGGLIYLARSMTTCLMETGSAMMKDRNGGKKDTMERTSDFPREENTEAYNDQWASREGEEGRTGVAVANRVLVANIDVGQSRQHSEERMRIQQQSQSWIVSSPQQRQSRGKDAKVEN